MENLLLAAFYLGIIIYLANQEALTGETQPLVRPLLYGLLILWMLLGLSIMMTAFMPRDFLEEVGQPIIAPIYGVFIGGVAVAVTIVGWLIIRDKRARLFIKYLAGRDSHYNPEQIIHTVAAVIALVLMGYVLINFLVLGGQEGLAQVLAENPITANEVLFQDVIYLLIALLGVGAFIRRDGAATRARLALRYPTQQDWLWGVLGGLALFVIYLIAISLIIALISAETLQQQTAATEQIAQTASQSFWLTIVLAVMPAITEEILYRGALQPIFGLWLTSFFFAIAHVQYIFTAATLVIFIVSMGLGWIRQRSSTTGAIIAHFFYNAILLMLAYISGLNSL